MMFISILMVVLVVTVQFSYQKPSLKKYRLQGRYRRNSDDIITGAPLSEEEFQLSLYQSVETNDKDPINRGFSTDGLFQGDIAGVEMDSDGNQSHNYVNSAEALWPNGIVPYVISDIFNGEDRKIIARGIRSIQDKSCIQFVPRTTETDYVAIMNGNGCYSQIGRTRGKQNLSLQRSKCVNVETVIHELMHALGFEHEHNRPDRDNYIRINEDNLEDEAFERHFKKFGSTRFSTSTNYDINSIMHYKSFVFAKNDSVPTIRSKKGTPKKPISVGSTTGFLSKLDQEKLNKLYKCDLSLAINMDCPVSYLGSNVNPCFKIPKFGCYCMVKAKTTRSEADIFCRDHQMQLVWFETKEENIEVGKLMIENDVSEFWTSGVNREPDDATKWRWEQYISSASFPIKEFNWCPNDPDNFDGDEYYILVKNIGIGVSCWQDAPDQGRRWPAVCKPPLSAKVLLDNLRKLHSLLKGAFSEIDQLEKKTNAALNGILALENTNNEVVNELKELKRIVLSRN